MAWSSPFRLHSAGKFLRCFSQRLSKSAWIFPYFHPLAQETANVLTVKTMTRLNVFDDKFEELGMYPYCISRMKTYNVRAHSDCAIYLFVILEGNFLLPHHVMNVECRILISDFILCRWQILNLEVTLIWYEWALIQPYSIRWVSGKRNVVT